MSQGQPDQVNTGDVELQVVEKPHPNINHDKLSTSVMVSYQGLGKSVQVLDQPMGFSTCLTPFEYAWRQMKGKNTSKPFYRLSGADGIFTPGTMNLILSPPGHGKSTFLKVVAGRLTFDLGEVKYNGLSIDTASESGIYVKKMTQYVDQIDLHLPLLTVKETLEFAHKCSAKTYDPNRVPETINMLGLNECQNTLIGNAMIRGVSGGQKKRVTVGEMLVGDATTLFIDEGTNGLDTATSEDIYKLLRKWVRDTNGTIVATLQQPTPGLYNLFDNIVCIRDSAVVFHGPREDVIPFFHGMGFSISDDADVCDFLIEALSQPRVLLDRGYVLEKQHAQLVEKNRLLKEAGKPYEVIPAHSALLQQELDRALHKFPRVKNPCLTVVEMIQYYHQSILYKDIENALAKIKEQSEGFQKEVVYTPEIYPNYADDEEREYLNKVFLAEKDSHEHHDREGATDGVVVIHKDHNIPRPVRSNPYYPYNSREEASMFSERSVHLFSQLYSLSPFMLFWATSQRQWLLTFRSARTLIPRIIQSLFSGLIYGALFINLNGVKDSFTRIALFFIECLYVSFLNLIFVPPECYSARSMYKQQNALFFPSWPFVIAGMLSYLPIFMIEDLIFVLAIYWMSASYAGAAQFFIHYFLLIWHSIIICAFFRSMSGTGLSEAAVHSIVGPGVGLLSVFSGFLITYSNIPHFMVWLYWISPFSWTCHSMALNEFKAGKYDDLVPANGAPGYVGMRVGDFVLRMMDMGVDHLYELWGFFILLGHLIIYLVVHIFALMQPNHELSRGTTRFDIDQEELMNLNALAEAVVYEEEEQDEEDRENGLDVIRENSLSTAMPFQPPIIDGVIVNTNNGADGEEKKPSRALTYSVRGSSNGQILNTLNTSAPFIPMWMSWSDIVYTVPVEKDGKIVDRTLLSNLCGYAQPGKLTALMGASGAGKTTLLDVLARRKNVGTISGSVLINGEYVSDPVFSRLTGYVEQFDTLFPFDTVQETLLFAARLRLPPSVSDAIKQQIVIEVMDVLNLTNIADCLIGDEYVVGLSPSQKKRVNIGVELVANPPIIFLDEPTTGLDSISAQTVCRVMQRLARSGRSLICTIHQPSSELFFMFDRLCLLASGGHLIYFGDLGRRSRKLIDYFEAIDGVQGIQPRVNPASWMLQVLGVGVSSAKEDKPDDGQPKLSQAEMVEKFKQKFLESPQKDKLSSVITRLENLSAGGAEPNILQQPETQVTIDAAPAPSIGSVPDSNVRIHLSTDGEGTLTTSEEKPITRRATSYQSYALPSSKIGGDNDTFLKDISSKPNIFIQYVVLQMRHFHLYWRNLPIMLIRVAAMFVLGVCYGLLYLQLNIGDFTSLYSWIGGILIATLFCANNHAVTALPVCIECRPVMYREKYSGMYQGFLWPICHLIVEMVFEFFTETLLVVPFYFMMGLEYDAAKFWKFFFYLFITVTCYTTISQFISAWAPSIAVAAIAQSSYLTFLAVFSNIPITLTQCSPGWHWLFHILPLQHAMEAYIMPQFEICSPMPQCHPRWINVYDGYYEERVQVASYVANLLGNGWYHSWDAIGYVVLILAVLLGATMFATQFIMFVKR